MLARRVALSGLFAAATLAPGAARAQTPWPVSPSGVPLHPLTPTASAASAPPTPLAAPPVAAPPSRTTAARRPSVAREAADEPLVYDRPRGTIDGGEAVLLYTLGGLYGLTLGAWAGVGVSDGSRAAPRVLLPVAGVAAGIIVSAVLDGQRTVRRGRVYAANAGFCLGLLGALGVATMDRGPLADASTFGVASAYLGGATIGLGAGLAAGHATDALPGSASFVLSGGAWGAWLGASLDYAFSDRPTGFRGEALLAGEAIGVVASLATAHLLRPTTSQSRWLDLGALLGAMTGALLFSQSSNGQTASLATALGTVAGGTLGFVLGAPSDGERELLRRQSLVRASPTFTPVAGGGIIGVSL